MRVGVALPRYDVGFDAVRGFASWVEESGFDSVWVTDHLQPTRGKTLLEPWTLLSALAVLTRRVRLGTTVLCYSYRHPAVLAKMASTLDRISGGRVELGVGTGSGPQVEEHRAMGIPYPGFGERAEQLKDYVRVLRLIWGSDGRVSFDSKHYPLRDAMRDSPTIQERIPIWVGARRRRMLRVAAEIGEGWNFYGDSLEEYEKAVKTVEEYLSELGADKDVPKAVFTSISIWRDTEDRQPEEKMRKSHTIIYGTPDEALRKIERLRKLGVSLIILRDLNRDNRNIKIFKSEVLPSL